MVVYVDLSRNPRGVTIIAVLWSMIVVSLIVLVLRLYSKIARTRHVWWDDYFIIGAWILLLVSCSTTTANVRLGFGLHQVEVPFENLIPFGIQSNISGFASVIAVALSKISFAITLLRLSDGWIRWFVIGLIVLLTVTHYTSAIFFWVSCNPPEKTWNFLADGECWPVSVTVNYSMFVGACSAFSDFALALLPWRLLLRFNMYNREKIGVAVCMSMGILAGISCIVKMTYIPLLYDGDFSYNSFPLVISGFIEPALTIIAASFPVMRHLVRSFRRDADGTLPPLTHSADPTATNPANAESRTAATASGAGSGDGPSSTDKDQHPEKAAEKAARGNYQRLIAAAAAANAVNPGTTETTLTEASSPKDRPSSPLLHQQQPHHGDVDSRSESSIGGKQAAAGSRK